MDRDRNEQDRNRTPSSDEELIAREPGESDELDDRAREERERRRREEEKSADRPNPPHTTTGKVTSPKFGSATSGGGELDPGYPKN